MANDSFAIGHKSHWFTAGKTVDSDHADSDFTALNRGSFGKLFMSLQFPNAPTTTDSTLVTLELHSASSNNDSDFTAVDTANFSITFAPAADSDTAYGALEADIDLETAGASKFLRPSLSVNAGVSLTGVSIFGALYQYNGFSDHDMADTDGPETNI